MNPKIKNYYLLILIYILGAITLLCSLIQQVIFLLSGVLLLEIGGIGNYLITIAAFILRFFIVDPDKFSVIIKKTDINFSENIPNIKELSPNRFLNLMPIGMVVGTIASAVIHQYNIIGVLIYLINQIILIIAFSGIIHFHPKILFSQKLKKKTITLISFWIILTIIVYFTMIFPGEKFMALGVIPYLISLVLMTLITYFGLEYKERSWKFRFSLCFGATSFLFSDTIIGYTYITNPDFYYSPFLIYPFWILAITFLQLAVLFLKTKDGKNIYKKE